MLPVFSLRDISHRKILFIPRLNIPAGSLYCITGKSGSGKTTLLKLLNNLITCDQGEVSYYSNNLLTLDPVTLRRRVVMVPQSPCMFPRTVLENIQLAFYFNRKELPAQGEIEQLLSVFDMAGMLNRETFTMSGGEKQRLALARAVLLDPETLLLDEPTAALDKENAEAVIIYLAQWVRKPGKSIVMITHAENIISDRAGYILYLAEGQILSLQERRGDSV